MPPQERKRRWWRIVLVLGIAMVRLVGAAAAYVVTQRGGRRLEPRRRVPRRADRDARADRGGARRARREEDRPGRSVHLAALRLHARPPPLPAAEEPAAAAVPGALAVPGQRAARVPAGDRRQAPLPAQRQRRPVRDRQAHRQGAVEAQASARSRPHRPPTPTARSTSCCCSASCKGPESRVGRVVALDGKTGKIELGTELASRSESSPLIDDGRLYFGSENGTVYAMDADDGDVRWRYRAERRGQGRARAGRRQALLRRLRRQRVRDPRVQRRRRSGASSTAAARSASASATSTRRPPSPTGACTSATPTGACTRSRPRLGQAGVEQEHRRLRLRVAGRRAGPGRPPARLRRLLQRPLLRARRAQRRRPLVARRLRPDLRRRDGDRRHRLLRRPRQQEARSGSARAPAARSSSTSAAPTTRSCPTARRSTSPATTRCTRCSR